MKIKIFFFSTLCFIFILKLASQEMPDEIRRAILFLPEDTLVGVGSAKEQSDGESILLAEDRARGDLAAQMNTMIQDMINDFTDQSFEEHITVALSNATIGASEIISRARGKDGTWWCVIKIGNRIGPYIYSAKEVLQIPKKFPLPSLSSISPVAQIPSWVLNPKQPEDIKWGLGAAKELNDNESIRVAKERAYKALINSFQVEVSQMNRHYKAISHDVSVSPIEFEELTVLIKSEYDSIHIETLPLEIAKTIDGTWWILLGCNIDNGDAITTLEIEAEKVSVLPEWVNNPPRNNENIIHLVMWGTGSSLDEAKERASWETDKILLYSSGGQGQVERTLGGNRFIIDLLCEDWFEKSARLVDALYTQNKDDITYYALYTMPRERFNILSEVLNWYVPAFKENSIENSIYLAANQLYQELPKNKKVAIISFASEDKEAGEFALEEITGYLSSTGTMQIYDRKSLDSIRKEMKFQTTGDVDDKSAVSIGKFAGADIVITGSITGTDSTRRMRFKALDIEKGTILSQTSHRF